MGEITGCTYSNFVEKTGALAEKEVVVAAPFSCSTCLCAWNFVLMNGY